jgi:hypothetical protein
MLQLSSALKQPDAVAVCIVSIAFDGRAGGFGFTSK